MSEVQDNAARRRFELQVEGGTAFIDYRLDGDVVNVIHTEVPTALEGRGIGSTLVKGALALIRSRGQKLISHCSFITAYIERHPEYHDLLA